MSTNNFKLNRSGVRQLLSCDEINEVVASHARDIQARCGEGYEVHVGQSGNRVGAIVVTGDYDAIADNAINNTLLKALHK